MKLTQHDVWHEINQHQQNNFRFAWHFYRSALAFHELNAKKKLRQL